MLNYNYFNGLTEKPDFLKRIKSGKVVINFSHNNSIEPLEIKLTEQNTKEYFEQDVHGLILKPFNILLIELDGEKLSEEALSLIYRLIHNVGGLNINLYDSNRPDINVNYFDVVIKDKKAYLAFRETIKFE